MSHTIKNVTFNFCFSNFAWFIEGILMVTFGDEGVYYLFYKNSLKAYIVMGFL